MLFYHNNGAKNYLAKQAQINLPSLADGGKTLTCVLLGPYIYIQFQECFGSINILLNLITYFLVDAQLIKDVHFSKI